MICEWLFCVDQTSRRADSPKFSQTSSSGGESSIQLRYGCQRDAGHGISGHLIRNPGFARALSDAGAVTLIQRFGRTPLDQGCRVTPEFPR